MNGKVWIQLKGTFEYTKADGAQGGPSAGGPDGDGLPFDATVYLKHNQTSSAGADQN